MTNKNFEDRILTLGAHKLHLLRAGEGEDVVFLHGWGSSASAFLFVANTLADDHRVTLLDFAGFGESDPPEYPYSVCDYATETLTALRMTGVARAHVVGHSFGGRVGIELSSKHPEFVKSLTLVDSAGLRPRRHLDYYIKVYAHKFLRAIGKAGLGGSDDYRVLSPLMKETFKKVVNYDQTPLLGNIFCPTAIFWGKDDRETPLYMARKFKRGIRDSALFMLDGGHFAFAEDSVTFCAVLRAFLSGVREGK